jgi:hypothetical protein
LVRQINGITRVASKAPNILSEGIAGAEDSSWFSRGLGWVSDSFNIAKARYWDNDIYELQSTLENLSSAAESYSPAYKYLNQIKNNLIGSIIGNYRPQTNQSEAEAEKEEQKRLIGYLSNSENLIDFLTSPATWDELNKYGLDNVKQLIDTLGDRGAFSQLEAQAGNPRTKAIFKALGNKQLTDELFDSILPEASASLAGNHEELDKLRSLAKSSVINKPTIDIAMQESEFKAHDIRRYSSDQFDVFAKIFSSHIDDNNDLINDKLSVIESMLDPYKEYSVEEPVNYRKLRAFLANFIDRTYEADLSSSHNHLYKDYHKLPDKAKSIFEQIMEKQYAHFSQDKVSEFKTAFRQRLGDLGPSSVNNLSKSQLASINFGNELSSGEIDSALAACKKSTRQELRPIISSINNRDNDEDKFSKYQELSGEAKGELYKALNNLPSGIKHNMYWGIKSYNDYARTNIFPFTLGMLNNFAQGKNHEQFKNLSEIIKNDKPLRDTAFKGLKRYTDLTTIDKDEFLNEILTPNNSGKFDKLEKIAGGYKSLAEQRYIRAGQKLYNMTTAANELENAGGEAHEAGKIQSFSREKIFDDLTRILNDTLKDPLLNFSISDGTLRSAMTIIQESDKALEIEDKLVDRSNGYMNFTPQAFSLDDRKYLADKTLEFTEEVGLSSYLKPDSILHQSLSGDIAGSLASSGVSELKNSKGQQFSSGFLYDLSSGGLEITGNSLDKHRQTLGELSDLAYNYYNKEIKNDSNANPHSLEFARKGAKLITGGNTEKLSEVFKNHKQEGLELLDNISKSAGIDIYGIDGKTLHNSLTNNPKLIEKASDNFAKGKNLSAFKNTVSALGFSKSSSLIRDNMPFIFSGLSRDYKTSKIAHIIPNIKSPEKSSNSAKLDLAKIMNNNLSAYNEKHTSTRGRIDQYAAKNKDLSNTKLKSKASFENLKISGFNFKGSIIKSSFKDSEIKNCNFNNISINSEAIDSLMNTKSIDNSSIKTLKKAVEKQKSSWLNMFSFDNPGREKLNEFERFLDKNITKKKSLEASASEPNLTTKRVSQEVRGKTQNQQKKKIKYTASQGNINNTRSNRGKKSSLGEELSSNNQPEKSR